MDFDCNFDAPMFVDFQNMGGDHQEREQAEAYFEVDHETDIDNQHDAGKTGDACSSNNVVCDKALNQENNLEEQISSDEVNTAYVFSQGAL